MIVMWHLYNESPCTGLPIASDVFPEMFLYTGCVSGTSKTKYLAVLKSKE